MKKMIVLAAAAVLSLGLSNCTTYTDGPSCTYWTNECWDYSNASADMQTTGQALCILGTWSTAGCQLSNCGTADADGIIVCTE